MGSVKDVAGAAVRENKLGTASRVDLDTFRRERRDDSISRDIGSGRFSEDCFERPLMFAAHDRVVFMVSEIDITFNTVT
jgi:hypothetical protein